VEVEMNECTGDEDVDDGQRVRNNAEDCKYSYTGLFAEAKDLLQNEVISVTRWGRQHDDDRHRPMLKKTSKWGVERAIASPEPGKG
jgi:hypothetical protein